LIVHAEGEDLDDWIQNELAESSLQWLAIDR